MDGLEESHGPLKRYKRKKDNDLSSSESTPVPDNNPIVSIRIRPPPLQPKDLKAIPHPPPFQSVELLNLSGDDLNGLPDFFQTEDHPINKRGFRYLQCSGNPSLSSVLYSIAEAEPHGPRIAYEDKSSQVHISKDGLVVTTNQGFRSARANVCIREGQWYYETKILRGNDEHDKSAPDAHVRIGITRREANLEAPVGHDAYGYGFRDVNGDKVHISRPSSFMNESFKTGDVIGIYVNIPRSLTGESDNESDNKDTNENTNLIPPDVYRDRIPIRYRGQLYFETLDYIPTKQMDDLILPTTLYNQKMKKQKLERFHPPTIPGSYIQVFKNGEDMGIAFKELIEFLPPHCKFQKNMAIREADDGQAGYYPTISVFKGGIAKFNFGPNFEYPITNLPYKPMSIRYEEQISDDIVYDLVDQIDFEIIDRLEDERLAHEALTKPKLPKSTSTLRNITNASSPSPLPSTNIVEIAPTTDA